MSPCPKVDQILAALIATDGTGEEVRRHVAACPTCSAQVAELTDVLEILSDAQASAMPDPWVDALVARVSPDRPEVRAWARQDLFRYVAPTFVLGVLTSALLLLWLVTGAVTTFDPVAFLLSALLCGLIAMAVDIGYLRRRGRAR